MGKAYHMGRRLKNALARAAVYIIGTAWLLFGLYPLFFTITSSFKEAKLIRRLPPQLVLFSPTLDNYRDLFEYFDFLRYLKNSLILAVGTTAIVVVLALLAAYALARLDFRGKRMIEMLLVVLLLVPAMTLIVPIYLLFLRLRLTDTLLGLMLLYSAFLAPSTTWMLRGFIHEIPRDLEDAAMIDGCSRVGAVFRVVLPLLGPGLVAVAILAFRVAWNEFLFALTLTGAASRTLTVAASAFRTDLQVRWGPLTAGATLILIPPLLFTLLMQRQLVRGLTHGAIK